MTTTALLSSPSLMLGSGAGWELPQPLGYAMGGGLAPSQILTLYATPVVYLCLDSPQRRLAPSRHGRLPRTAAAPGEATTS